MFLLYLMPMLLLQEAKSSALPLKPGWVFQSELKSPHATQAAAADRDSVYAVSNTTIAQYDRATGKLLASGTTATTKHLNSAFVHEGKVYCAHSNYPAKPDESDIRVFDPKSKTLAVFKTFTNPPGSLVWCLHDGQHWWCCFAHYGSDNAKTVLIRYAEGWKEAGRWTFPKNVVDDWDGMSASGGVFQNDDLLVTHHHFQVIYRLSIPRESGELKFVGAYKCPFPGQGIAVDPVGGGLVGISRPSRTIVFAEPAK